jgi:hypothetical protein
MSTPTDNENEERPTFTAIFGLCERCGADIECHSTFNGKLRYYEQDAGDLVPHDCTNIKRIVHSLRQLDLQRQLPDNASGIHIRLVKLERDVREAMKFVRANP